MAARTRRNTDIRLRTLEREAATGDPGAMVRLDVERARTGDPTSVLSWLVESGLEFDVWHALDYIPAPGVLSNRERGRQEELIDAVGHRVLGDQYYAWSSDEDGWQRGWRNLPANAVEEVWDGPYARYVGYRDNRDRGAWLGRMDELAYALDDAGYKVYWVERSGAIHDAFVPLDGDRIRVAGLLHDTYASMVVTRRAVVQAAEKAVMDGDLSALPAHIENLRRANRTAPFGLGLLLWRGRLTGITGEGFVPAGETIAAVAVIEPRRNKDGWNDPRVAVWTQVDGPRGPGWSTSTFDLAGVPEWIARLRDTPRLIPRQPRKRRNSDEDLRVLRRRYDATKAPNDLVSLYRATRRAGMLLSPDDEFEAVELEADGNGVTEDEAMRRHEERVAELRFTRRERWLLGALGGPLVLGRGIGHIYHEQNALDGPSAPIRATRVARLMRKIELDPWGGNPAERMEEIATILDADRGIDIFDDPRDGSPLYVYVAWHDFDRPTLFWRFGAGRGAAGPGFMIRTTAASAAQVERLAGE